MWGDKDDIDKLKKAEKQGWPDFPPIDPKKAKKEEAERAKADRAAEKAAEAEARKLAKWGQMPPPAKPTKQPPPAKRPTATDIANLKAEAWEAKQQQKAMRDAWRAQQDLLKAEKTAAKLARWQADEDRRIQRETAALWKAAKQRDLARPTSEASDYAYDLSTGGCATTAFLLLLLVVLIAVLLLCVCDCLV